MTTRIDNGFVSPSAVMCPKCGNAYTVDHCGCPQCAITSYRAEIERLRSEVERLSELVRLEALSRRV